MSIIDTLALITIALGTLKLLAFFIAPNELMSLAKGLLSKPKLLQVTYLVLAGVILYYLLEAHITILEIFAVMLFVRLLMAAALAPIAQPILKNFDPKKWIKEEKLMLAVMILLFAWGIKDLFF